MVYYITQPEPSPARPISFPPTLQALSQLEDRSVKRASPCRDGDVDDEELHNTYWEKM